MKGPNFQPSVVSVIFLPSSDIAIPGDFAASFLNANLAVSISHFPNGLDPKRP
jgi:hypothetical protein